MLLQLLPLALSGLLPGTQDAVVRGQEPPPPHMEDIKTLAAPLDPARYATDPQRPPSLTPPANASPRSAADALGSTGVAHDIDRLHVDRPQGTDHWVRGADYKAHFGPHGFTFIPFLGSEAPRNYPVRFHLESAEAAGQTLTLERGLQAIHTGDAMNYARGPIDERYLLDLDGVEQTFIFHEPSSGPLSVTVALETELTTRGTPEGLEISNELGGVRLGQAFAVDALGQRLPLDTEFDGERYRIEVPAEFVAEATFPLTIDPIVATFAIDTFSASLTNPRSAWDPVSDTFIVVYNENFSAADSDIYYTQIDIGGLPGSGGYVDSTSSRWHSPDAGCARASGMVLIAAIADSGSGTNGTIQGRLINPSSPSLGTAFQIDAGLTDPLHSLCVGGDPLDRFLCCWVREFSPSDRDVHARVVLDDGTPLGTSNILVDNSSADFNYVSCSKHNGSLNPNSSAWALALQFTGPSSQEVWGATIGWSGGWVDTPYEVEAFPSWDMIFPQVSSPLEQAGPKTYLVTSSINFTSDYDLWGNIVREGAEVIGRNLSGEGLAGQSLFDDEFLATLDCNGPRFCVAYRDGQLGNFDNTYCATINFVASSLCVSQLSSIDSSGDLFPSGVTARASGGLEGGEFLIVSEDEGVSGEDIYGTHYDDYQPCLGTAFCSASTNSTGLPGSIYALGSGSAGSFTTLYATRLPLNQFGYFLVSRNTGFVAPTGSQGALCLSGNIGRYNTMIQNSGSYGSFSIITDTGAVPLNPTVAVLPGETLHYQCWYRDVNPTATSNFTQAVSVTYQ